MSVPHQTRFFDAMEEGTLAIFFSSPVDKCVKNIWPSQYQQDPNFFYLLPFEEPQSALVLFKGRGEERAVSLFCRNKDPDYERWNAPILGPEAARQRYPELKATYAYSALETELIPMLQQAENVYHGWSVNHEADQRLLRWLGDMGGAAQTPTLRDWRPLLSRLRLQKDDRELVAMEYACAITVSAHLCVMQRLLQCSQESQIQGILYHEFCQYPDIFPAYPAIVAGGTHGLNLHYSSNNAPLDPNSLLLVDAGCRYRGYNADVTRTLPVSGRMTQAQRLLYSCVLKAQLAAIAVIKPGATFEQVEQAARIVLVEGLIQWRLLKGSLQDNLLQRAYKPFYMHSIGHWIGLAVHDVGGRGYSPKEANPRFQPGMVLTVEPGLYIPLDPERFGDFSGQCIRIEDMVVVTQTGHTVLTQALPKEITAIENLILGGTPLAESGAL